MRTKMRKQWLVLVLALAVIVSCVGCTVPRQESSSGSSSSDELAAPHSALITFPENDTGELTALTLSEDFQFIQTNKNVQASSIVRYEEDKFLICHYRNLQILDWNSGQVTELEPLGLDSCEILGTLDETLDMAQDSWNPTGLCFDQETGKLYVANYNGHNILIGTISSDNKFNVEQMIVSEGLISPENVALSDDGTRIAVADYDGNALFLFKSNGELLWKREVLLAHGVEISGDAVYCTSLQTREIIKFDWDGNELCRVGHLANHGVNAYMWPVALELFGNRLLVSDAHTGMITLLDKDLNYISAIGTNGPYLTNWDYPYAVLAEEDALYVTDTFKNRVVQLNLCGDLVAYAAQDALSEQSFDHLDYVPEFAYDIAYLYEECDEIPVDFCNPFFSGGKVVGGFSSVWYVQDENNMQQIKMRSYDQRDIKMFSNRELYAMWATKIQANNYEFYVFGSPQNTMVLFFEPEKSFGGILFCQDAPFLIDNCLYNSSTYERMEDDITTVLSELTDNFFAQVNQGQFRYAAYVDTMLPYYNKILESGSDKIEKDELEIWLNNQASQSAAGKELMEKILAGNADEDDLSAYFFRNYTSRDQNQTILENIFLRTFTSSQQQDQIKQIELESANSELYYPDHGIEDALDDDLDGYAAMLETEPAKFTLKVSGGDPVSFGSVFLQWESDDNFATDYTISFKCDGQEVGSIEMTNQESALQYALINNITADEMTVTVRNFKGENRVLLRQIKAWEWK